MTWMKELTMTWTNPTFSVGWLAALILAILAIIFWVQGTLPKEWALAILAVCAVKL